MLQTALSEQAARVMLLIVTAIAVATALKIGQPVAAPVVFGLVLGIVVSPVADRLARFGVPRVLIAIFLLAVATSALAAVIMMADPLILSLSEQLPRLKEAIGSWLAMASNVMRGIESISQEIETTMGGDMEVGENMPSIKNALWLAPNFVAQLFIFMGALFFFVLTRDELYAAAGPMEQPLKTADRAVSRYFGAVTLVNTGLGVVTAVVLMVIGVEYAPLWGLAAGLMNFILYLGPMIIASGLLIAGLLQFPGAMALLPPTAFLLTNLIEAQFVTPVVVGQKLAMSPLVVFLAIVFGLWLWGPVGAIVALPVLLWFGVLMRPGVLSQVKRRRFRHSEAA